MAETATNGTSTTSPETLKAQILDRITKLRSGVTFVELRDIPGFEGDQLILLDGPGIANVVLWCGVSQEAVTAIQELLAEGRITYSQAHVLAYLIDGGTLSLPLAKRAKAYKRLRWLPVAFNLAGASPRPGGRAGSSKGQVAPSARASLETSRRQE